MTDSNRANAASANPPAKRSYMRRNHRRRMLLDAAAELVVAQGWAALTMSALAERAGTSRQTVYHHFDNLHTLVSKTAWHIFNDTIEATRASIASHPDDLHGAVETAEAVTLDLSPGHGDALWQLIAGTAGATPELERIRMELRTLITHTWKPPVARQLDLEDDDAGTVSWLMVMAFWGLRQLIRDEAVDREHGMRVFNDLLARLLR